MLGFSIKNMIKNEKQEKKDNSKKEDSLNETENNLKHEMIASILRGNKTSDQDRTITFADVSLTSESVQIEPSVPEVEQIKTKPKPIIQTTSDEKIPRLIHEIEATQEKMIIPTVDFGKNIITYPILEKIGERPDNVDFLEKLASADMDILDRIIFERFSVCPKHPESLAVTVRLYCPKCNSMDIEKLHLIEHKRCGYISEQKSFETSSDGTITKCPSCKRPIRDTKKEIGIPAMWYRCIECNQKFDDVSIKLHCRKHNHDFDMYQSKTVMVPGFVLKNLAYDSSTSIGPILDPLKKLFESFGFSAEENRAVTGRSGNRHFVNVYGRDDKNRTVFIFVKNPRAENDNSELNSKIIEVLDTSPTVAILIGFPTISEKAKAITANYNISLVSEQNPKEILSSIEGILAEKLSSTGV